MKTFMFVFVALLAAVCLNTAVVLAQPDTQGDIEFLVTVGEEPLTVAVNAGVEVTTLTAGQTVALVPAGDGTFIEPATGFPVDVAANSTPGDVSITGDASAAVLVSFALPTVLYPGTGPGVVYVAYNGTSAMWGNEGDATNYFDPNVPTAIILSATAGDATSVYLGGIFTVAPNSAADDYAGDAIITVSYISNN
jgi:hypothetical protein